MGFRIVDKSERKILERLEEVRRELIESEAKRFGMRQAHREADSTKEFIQKIDNISKSIEDSSSALALVERLEEIIRTRKKNNTNFVGELERATVVDLLSMNDDTGGRSL